MKLYHPPVIESIFDWLDGVRARPFMYFAELWQLQLQISGYCAALAAHGIDEHAPSMDHFASWLEVTHGWGSSLGWAEAIVHNSRRSHDDPASRFFALVDEFRRLRPKIRARVRLGQRHQPTGSRVNIGFDGVYAKPAAIEIRQLSPAPLHYLRFIHPRQSVDHGALWASPRTPSAPDHRHRTTLAFAKRWVEDEYQVTRDEWVSPTRGTPTQRSGRRASMK